MVIFSYEWRQLRWYTLWWSLGCSLSMYAMFPVYLGMITSGAADMGMLTNNPVFDLLGVDPVVITQPIGVFGFLTSFFAIAAGINGMFLGLKTFTKETVGRSAEFLYTKPCKRRDIFTAKVSASFVSALTTGLCYYGGAMVSGIMNVPELDFILFSLVALSFLWIQLFFLLLGALVGTVCPKIRTPLLFSSGVVFIFYVFSAFAGKVGAGFIKYLTPYSWFGASVIIKNGGYHLGYLIAGILFCVVFKLVALTAFTKKDTTLIS